MYAGFHVVLIRRQDNIQAVLEWISHAVLHNARVNSLSLDECPNVPLYKADFNVFRHCTIYESISYKLLCGFMYSFTPSFLVVISLSNIVAQAHDLSVFEGDDCTAITVYGQSPWDRRGRHRL